MPDPPLLAALASVMPVGLLRTDIEGRCVYISERAAEMTGLTAGSVIRSGWEQRVHSDDRAAVSRHVLSVLDAGTPGQAEFRCLLPDGRLRWLLSQAMPEHDRQGRLVGFVWTLTDTTNSQEALRANEERFKLATRSAGVGVLDYDVAADQGFWSPELCALLGVPEGPLRTLGGGLDFCHADDRARIEAAMNEALDSRGSGAFAEELRIRRADTGEVRWVTCTCQTHFDGAADARRAVRFTGTVIDVTERKVREAQVQALSDQLLRSEERQAFLLRLSDALRLLGDPLDTQETASRLLGEYLGVNRVGYAEIEGHDYVIRREYAHGVPSLAAQGPTGTWGAAMSDAYRNGETVVVNDTETDPRFTEAERTAMRGRQVAAFVGVLLLKGGRLVAAFGANHATPREWAPDEIALVREVAERTWDAVARASAEAALREREQRLRLALEASGGGSWTWEASSNRIDWDEGFRARYGFTPEEPATHDGWMSRLHEEDRPQVIGLLEETLRSTSRESWDNTFRIVRPDESVSWIQSVGRVDRDADGRITRLTGLDLDVTERRRAEEARHARREEERNRELQLLLETATQGIVSVDGQARIVTANRSLEEMFGWAPGELIGQPIERLVPLSLHDAHAGYRAEYFAAPRPRRMGVTEDIFGRRKDGSTIPLEISLNHIPTAAGGHAIAFVTDITERKRSVEFERFLFDLSKAFIAIPEENIDANMTDGLARVGTFLKMDRVTLLELSPDRAAMTVAYSWSHPDVPTPPPVLREHRVPWWVGQVLRGDVSLAAHVDDLPAEAVAEKEYLREQGVASVASIPLKVAGEIAGAISFVTMHRHLSWTPELVSQLRAIGDILWNALKRRQAMQALLAARETARESEERFRLIANTAPVMIWMSDIDKQVTYVNQRWLDFTGWPPNVAPGHRWIELIHPDDVERCGDVYVKAFDQRKPFEVEHRLRRHDGEHRWTVTAGVPRYGADRSFVGYVGTAVDVTDRKLAEASLRDSHGALQERTIELERRTAQLSRLASDLTLAEQHAREELAKTLHDGLQQLLVSSAMSLDRHVTEAAQQHAPPSEPLVRARGHLDEAIAAARSLSMELSPPALHGLGLPAALTWLAERARSQYGLAVQVSADPRANSDRKDVRTLLFESVRELLFNAVKHAQVDRVTIDLSLDQDDALHIAVADEGIGFDPAGLVERWKAGQAGWVCSASANV